MLVGMFGTAFNIMGGAFKGATTASMWTGNMIYTALQRNAENSFMRQLVYGKCLGKKYARMWLSGVSL